MAYSEDVDVTVRMRTEGVEETSQQISSLGSNVVRATIPSRVLGRDLMSLAFGINFMARHLGIVNPALDSFLTILMAVGVTIRTLTIIQSVTSMIHGFSGATMIAAAAQKIWNVAMEEGVLLMTVLTAGAALVVGLAAYALYRQHTTIPSMQAGGYVPQTGPYYLHKGETVVPASGTNYSWVNINMTTGPVSSGIDIDRMLDQMAVRMVSESRRRTGH